MTDTRPTLWRDTAFWGINLTQFFGAFNDNLYKELVLLLCLDHVGALGDDRYQSIAGGVFSVPFILFSGTAGMLSDRFSKRTVIILCKVAEIVVMLAGMLAFWVNSIPALMAVLFLMGTHSAFFGPSKYGILPEMLRREDLPRANGVILMTTFLAIIFGFVAAGYAKELFGEAVWLACSLCVLVAVVGTCTSILIRPTAIAEPDLKFHWDAVAIPRQTLALVRANRPLLGAVLACSVFYLVAGVVYPPAINALGKLQMKLGDKRTGALAATIGGGIAVGCILAGFLCRHRVRSLVVRTGAAGLVVCLILLALPGPRAGGTWLGVWGSAVTLAVTGLFAGLFSVPLQVFVQARAPQAQKGRVIAATNLMMWIGICLSAVVYGIANQILVVTLGWPPASAFAVSAMLMLPLALFYRPPELELRDDTETA
ncbi:MAG: MFS transporter [Planctomycetaceae bacterium]